MAQRQVQTSIIVPAFNEEAGLAVVLPKLCEVVDSTYEIIVVDDGSMDRTASVASGFPCTLLVHEHNQGKGAAMKTGIAKSQGENVIFIDADDTYPVEAIADIVKGLETYDMVVCSRVEGRKNVPLLNRFGNASFRFMIRILSGFGPKDPLTGLYGLKKKYIEAIHLESNGFGIETEIAIKVSRMRLKLLDIPITYRSRIGKAKLHWLRDGSRIMFTVFKYSFKMQDSR